MKSRKRLLSLFLSLAVMLTMCVTTATAMDADNGSAATITVETVKQAVKVDDEVTLNVSIANNPGFVVFDFTIQYDKEKLELQGIENGSFEGSLLGNTAAGKVNFTGDVQQECMEDGTLFILKFKVKADCSNGTQVGLKATTFKNANNATILPTIVSGGMTSGSTTGGSTTGGSTTGGSTTGGSTTGGSTTGGSTTGGSTTGGSTTGGSTTGGSTTGGSTTGGSTTGGSTTGGSTTGGSTTGGSTTGGSTTGGSTTGGSTTGGSTTGGSTTGGSTTGGSTTGGSTTGGSTTGGSPTGSDRKVELVGKSNGATYKITGNMLNVQNDAACVVLWTDDNGATCTVTVTAKPVPIKGIALSDAAVSVGRTIQLEPVFTPADTTQRDVIWTSSDRTIATVDANGRVRGVSEGKVTITVTSTADPSIRASCTVTVTKNLSDAGLAAIIGALGNGSLPFNDVTVRDYFYDAVKWAVDRGITSGTSRYTFSPDAPCTRAQVVTFLWRAAGCPQPTSKSNPFTDVRADDYFYDAVLWAVEHGITNGTSAKTFSPDATVTRAQVVTFLWRANGQPTAGNSGFADVSADKYYATAVAWAVFQRITTGTGFGVFSPDAACTRAQIVTFLYRAN